VNWLFSYQGSGSNYIRYCIEFLSKRPTQEGCDKLKVISKGCPAQVPVTDVQITEVPCCDQVPIGGVTTELRTN
jgi:hypothetical protein